MLAEAIETTLRVTRTLTSLGVRYVVGGSLASSLQGIPRATNDVDLVAAMELAHAEPFVDALGADFYADLDMIRDAIARRTEFNVIFQPAIFKIDVFVPPLDVLVRRELARARVFALGDGRELALASPEDVIAQKLRWYRLGGHVSDRQWEDALGVVKTHRGRLEREYLDETAEALGVTDLLDELLREGNAEPLQ